MRGANGGTSHVKGSLVAVKAAKRAVKHGWRPKAGLTDRNQGTGEPEGSPTRAAQIWTGIGV
jgi:hypothetical protein